MRYLYFLVNGKLKRKSVPSLSEVTGQPFYVAVRHGWRDQFFGVISVWQFIWYISGYLRTIIKKSLQDDSWRRRHTVSVGRKGRFDYYKDDILFPKLSGGCQPSVPVSPMPADFRCFQVHPTDSSAHEWAMTNQTRAWQVPSIVSDECPHFQ